MSSSRSDSVLNQEGGRPSDGDGSPDSLLIDFQNISAVNSLLKVSGMMECGAVMLVLTGLKPMHTMLKFCSDGGG